jgi:hypothetical protein
MKDWVCVLLTLAIAPKLLAHHSDVAFDMESVIVLEGTVTEFSWRNPHVYMNIAVPDGSGSSVEWQFQTHPTMVLTRSGWSRDSIGIGDIVTLRGHPDQNPDRAYAILVSAETADGTALDVITDRDSESAAVAIATSLNGRWRLTTESVGRLIEEFQSTPLTARAEAAMTEFDMAADETMQTCMPLPAPVAFPGTITLYVGEIDITADRAYLRSEYFDTERVVYMDGRDHPSASERFYHGHSIGRWDGGVLVVDTTNFEPHRSPYQAGIPSGLQKHLVERYVLTDDGTSLLIDLTLEDPEYFDAPISSTLELKFTPNAEMYRYNCQPDVAGQFAF